MSTVDVVIDFLAMIGVITVIGLGILIYMLNSPKWCMDDPYDKAESEDSEDERNKD